VKDAPTKSRQDESVTSIGQLAKPAFMKDAPTKAKKEESARSMGQSKLAKPAVMKDAQLMPSRGELVGDMRFENWGQL